MRSEGVYHPHHPGISSPYKRLSGLYGFLPFTTWCAVCPWMVLFLVIGYFLVIPARPCAQEGASRDTARPGVMLFLAQAQFIEKKGKLFVISKKGKRILGEIELIPENRAFYFYINENIYTGRVAYNIKDFLEIIKTIDVNAIEFHVQRKDFEKWIREVFVDEEFAKEVAEIGMLRISGENLRERLYEVVDKKHKMLNLFLI